MLTVAGAVGVLAVVGASPAHAATQIGETFDAADCHGDVSGSVTLTALSSTSTQTPANLVVADLDAGDGNGALIRLGLGRAQEMLSAGGQFQDPSGVVFSPVTGDRLLVADRGAAGGAVIAVDPYDGSQQVLTSGGMFVRPIAITVAPPLCAGKYAVEVGTNLADEISDSFSPIALMDGDDRAGGGLRGDDRICGGDGDDRLLGGSNDDRAEGTGREGCPCGRPRQGQAGRGQGKDRCVGGPGRDVARGC
jgi:hypothetical protein